MPRESKAARAVRALRIVRGLFRAHPGAHCELDHENAYELLVATILAAQSTDKLVNTVTPELFRRYPDARRLAAARAGEIEPLVHSTGYFRQKTKAILGMARAVVEHHGAEIPGTMDGLVSLPGVGRKTANVILGNCFDTPGIVVDTHVTRLSQRLGLTREMDPVKIERDLNALVPQKEWTRFSHAMIFHGRRTCFARTPQCEGCPLYADCRFPHQRERPEAIRKKTARESTRKKAASKEGAGRRKAGRG